MMLSKKEQTRKKKIRDDKRLETKEMIKYKAWIKKNYPTCQAHVNDKCEHITMEAHHVLFGCYGADKDDRFLIGVCMACHRWCHTNKSNSRELFLHVARENWKQYGGSDEVV